MEDDIDMYEVFGRMSKMVDILYAVYKEKMERDEWEKERAEDDAPSTPSSVHSNSSSSSHHLDEEID